MKNFLKPKFLIGIVFSIIGLYFSFKGFDFISFTKIIKEANLFYIFIASLLLVFSVWLRSIRWHYLLLNEKSIPFKILFEIEMLGFFGNNVLPLRLGELYRGIILSNITKIPKSTVLGSIVLERIFDTMGLMFFSVVLLLYPIDDQIKKYISFSIIFILIVGIILFIFYKFFYKKIQITMLKNFLRGVYGLDKKYLFKNISITIFLWSIFWMNTFLIQYSLNIEMTIMGTLLIFIISTLSIAIPSAPGTIGTFHLAVVYTMESILGYSSIIAHAYAILLHAFGFITLTLIGSLSFIKYQTYNFSITKNK